MKLQTERLNLLPMGKRDLEVFHRCNINAHVKQFLWDNREIPETLSAEILQEVEERFRKEKWGLWKITNSQNNEYMGYAGFWYFFGENQPQLLYALLPEYTGKGYATEASESLIDYAFDHLHFDHVTAAMDKPNSASENVCKRLNMYLVEEKRSKVDQPCSTD